jgi:DNA-binding GntR family transcriptional regulator
VKTTTRQIAYDYIWDRLVCGDLGPGDRVSPAAVSQVLGVSHIPVREAIGQLCAEGLLDRDPHRGVFVSVPDRQEVVQLLEMRAALENYAAGQSARRISEAELDDLERLVHAMREIVDARCAHDDAEAFVARWGVVDMMFHRVLLRSAGNQEILRVIEKGIIRTFGFHSSYSDLRDTALADFEGHFKVHFDVFDAVRRRDPKAARRAMKAHSQRARRNLLLRLDLTRRGDGHGGRPLPSDADYPESLRRLIQDIEEHFGADPNVTEKLPLDDSLRRVWKVGGARPAGASARESRHQARK